MAMKINGENVTVIGITGTIGAGKSTVGKILAQMGVPVIDTDKIAHALLAGDEEVKNLIKMHFPSAIKTDAAGLQIDRKQLGAIVFKDAKAKKQLELILHPRVRQICKQQTIEQAQQPSKPKLIAVLIPLLFENQLQSLYDQTWAVIVEDKILRQRLLQRDGLSLANIDLRLSAQMSQEEKAKLADVVLDNSGSESELRDKVQHLVENLCQKSC
jgi:dephospho-CoA kinase